VVAQKLQIKNRDLRRLWLAANGLMSERVNAGVDGVDVMRIIRKLGFLQIDTVRNIARAHHHILWSRNQHYSEAMLWPLLRHRKLFEHFTHDASLIPMEVYPIWQRQFRRLGQKAAQASWYQSGLAQQEIRAIRDRIEAEGPLSTHAFDTKTDSREMWSRPPHKRALEQMWLAGELATSHRRNFVKFYDLGERVFPAAPDHRDDPDDDRDHVDRLCDAAIDQLGLATRTEIKRFWDAVQTSEVGAWLDRRKLMPVRVETADGRWHDSWAVPDIEQRLQESPTVSRRLRIINPFDPAIRDRTRLNRLFGFEYTNEMFVPQAKRRYGYYVYPLLDGDRFVGRIEVKGERKAGWMRVSGFWPEPGISWTSKRVERLTAELERFARLASLTLEPGELPVPRPSR
jgi:uncharacterized protein YcaQ